MAHLIELEIIPIMECLILGTQCKMKIWVAGMAGMLDFRNYLQGIHNILHSVQFENLLARDGCWTLVHIHHIPDLRQPSDLETRCQLLLNENNCLNLCFRDRKS